MKKLEPILIIGSIISIITLLDIAMKNYKYRPKWDNVDRWMFIVSLFVIFRFIYDRPGFIGLGASEGGFMTGISYVCSVIFYYVIIIISGSALFTRKQLIFISFFSVLTIFWAFVFGDGWANSFVGRRLTNEPTWLFCAVSLALLATSKSYKSKNQIYYLLMMFFLGVGLFSGYRSRIFFFMAEILIIGFLTRRFMKTSVILSEEFLF